MNLSSHGFEKRISPPHKVSYDVTANDRSSFNISEHDFMINFEFKELNRMTEGIMGDIQVWYKDNTLVKI